MVFKPKPNHTVRPS